MAKKYLTMAEKTQDNINKVKKIIKDYENFISDNPKDKEEIEDRKIYMDKMLKSYQEDYAKYIKTNEPYFDTYSYEYYKNKFSKIDKHDLDINFISDVTTLADSEIKSSLKGNALENICKAYEEIRKQ